MSALFAMALLLAAPSAESRVVSVAAYRESLVALAASLREGRLEEARSAAADLAASRVSFGHEVVASDASLLGPAAAVASRDEARHLADRAARLAAALDAAEEIPGASDPARLERLRAEESVAAIGKGGVVPSVRLKPLSVPEQVVDALRRAWHKLREALRSLERWLWRLWPSRRLQDAGDGFALDVSVLLFVAATVGVLAVLAWRTLRRGRRAPAQGESSREAASTRDDDPLSREASEWERYAAELAAAGRRREAVRAWYHAVLMALFRSGSLHFQKGRTNWEYVARVGPEAPWRPAFIAITRLFDHVWYGHERSSAETLADCVAEARTVLLAMRAAA